MARTQTQVVIQSLIQDITNHAPYSKLAATVDRLGDDIFDELTKNDALFETVSRHFLDFQSVDSARPVEDSVCCLLYELFHTGSPTRQLFVISNLPYFLWSYLSRATSISTNPNLEACLIGLYNSSITPRSGPNPDSRMSPARRVSRMDDVHASSSSSKKLSVVEGFQSPDLLPLQNLKSANKARVIEHMFRLINLNIQSLPFHSLYSLMNIVQWTCGAGHPSANLSGLVTKRLKANYNTSSHKPGPFIADTIQFISGLDLNKEEIAQLKNSSSNGLPSSRADSARHADALSHLIFEPESLGRFPRIHLSVQTLLEFVQSVRFCFAIPQLLAASQSALRLLDCRAQGDMVPEVMLAVFQVSFSMQEKP